MYIFIFLVYVVGAFLFAWVNCAGDVCGMVSTSRCRVLQRKLNNFVASKLFEVCVDCARGVRGVVVQLGVCSTSRRPRRVIVASKFAW